jgi:hypothetical protein
MSNDGIMVLGLLLDMHLQELDIPVEMFSCSPSVF